MADSLGARWKNYQPSKGTVVWGFFAGIVATLVVGFAVFGWYTAGGAREMAENAAEDAQAKLASAICVERFINTPAAATNLAELKEESTWSRDSYIQDGGWVTFARFEGSMSEAAELCAETLVEMEAPLKSASEAKPMEG